MSNAERLSERTAGPSPVDPDEQRLVQGLIAASPKETGEFIERTHHAVFAMAWRLTRDPDLRRDWTHEVLLQILEDLRQGRFVYRRAGGFWSWFRKRAYYRLLDAYRRHRVLQQRESVTAEGDPPELPGGEDPAAELERAELRGALEECLSRLANLDHRRALWLLLFEDMAYQDISDAIGAPLNTVRAWIRRARLGVRKCLAERLGWELEAPRSGQAGG